MQDVCLFAHFDRDDIVDDYVFRYLTKIKDLSFAIVFISTAKINDNDRARLLTICEDVIVRDNAGLDFGSWAAGFAKHEATISGRLLLANDSVYGPIGDLDVALRNLTSVKADFYGFVQSADISPHLQSWFLLFESHVVRSQVFRATLGQSFETMTKPEIIKYGEVGLSSALLALGLTPRALYGVKQTTVLMRWFSFNPMHHLWYEMLAHEGVPFIKVELLRDNPVAVYDVDLIAGVVSATEPELWRLISNHQTRMGSVAAGRTSVRSLPKLRSLGRYLGVILQKLLKQAYYAKRSGHHITGFAVSTLGISIILTGKMWRAIRRKRRAPAKM